MPSKHLPCLFYLASESEREALKKLSTATGESVSNLTRRAIAQQYGLDMPPLLRGAKKGNQYARKSKKTKG